MHKVPSSGIFWFSSILALCAATSMGTPNRIAAEESLRPVLGLTWGTLGLSAEF